jgi:2,3,4,5-tetrahydropyridine-2,6-dicarboxylate N-succinyltransferase
MKHDLAALASTIETAFDARDTVSTSTRGEVRDAVETALNLLDLGEARVASRGDDGSWTVNQWLKKAVLLSFRLNPMEVIKGGPGEAVWWDKVPSKFEGLERQRIRTGRLPGGSRIDRPARFVHRQERGADAVLRQSRRLCR